MLPRRHLFIFIPALAISVWLGMMLTHETGHLLAALLTGGHIQQLVFHPLAFSRTDVSPNPHPLIVIWAGPIFGAAFPFILSRGFHLAKIPSYTLDVLAAFCLLANGAYIAFASIPNIADARDLFAHGAPLWTLWLFGVPALAGGLLLFHRLGPKLGLSRAKPIDVKFACVLAMTLIVAGICVTAIQRPHPEDRSRTHSPARQKP
jgi:hypothetical protein